MGSLSPHLFFRVPSRTLAPFGRPLGLWGRGWHRASCQFWGWPWWTQGKAELQSAARYWYTCQVLPKSEERSISMPAGTGPCGDTRGVGMSHPARGTRSQKDALKCWGPLRTPARREKEGRTEQVGQGHCGPILLANHGPPWFSLLLGSERKQISLPEGTIPTQPTTQSVRPENSPTGLPRAKH